MSNIQRPIPAKKKIGVYCFGGIYGGTEILLKRVAELLTPQYEVFFIYQDINLLSKLQLSCNVIAIKMATDCKLELDFSILSSKSILELLANKSLISSKRYLFWQLQHDELCTNFFPGLQKIRRYLPSIKIMHELIANTLYYSRRRDFAAIVSKLVDSKSIVFMDGANLRCSESWLGKSFGGAASFLPVFGEECKDSNIQKNRIIKTGSDLNILIVSRISNDFKYYPLIATIENLIEVSQFTKIDLRIVGDGNSFQDLKAFVNQVNLKEKNIKIKLLGFLPIERVKTELYALTDLAIGMGTSLIDSSSYGIPTIVMNPSDIPIKHGNARYKWFFEMVSYSLGDFNPCKKKGRKLYELISEFFRMQTQLSELCKRHVTENHSQDFVIKTLIEYIERPGGNFDISDFLPLLNRNVFTEKIIKSINNLKAGV